MYRAIRNEVLTMVTLQELESHDLHIQEPMSFIEICVHGGQYPDRYLRSAIADCQDQAWDHKRIQLTVLQCRALLTLVDVVGWTIHEGGPSYHITCSKNWDISHSISIFDNVYLHIDYTALKSNYAFGFLNYCWLQIDDPPLILVDLI